MRGWAVAMLLVLPALGDEVRDYEESLFRRWEEAGPDERRRLGHVLDRLERGRRFTSARPVLVPFGDRAWSLAEIFTEILEPALQTPTAPQSESDPGLAQIHRDALAVLAALRDAYAPPQPVTSGTLNLFLRYASDALSESVLPPAIRLRFFLATVRNVREFDGRAAPDARTGWLVRIRLVPALRSLARRATGDAEQEAISEVASLLQLPSILDARARAQLAPLSRGAHSRTVLRRLYREGQLDDLGRVALARSVVAQARDDDAFAAGAPPLVLELLCDPLLPPAERARLLGVVFDRLAAIDVLAATSRDLLAAGFGGPPRPLAAYERDRKAVPLPAGEKTFRFLSVVLLQERPSAPPVVTRVIRRDLEYHEALHAAARQGQRFAGVLLPDATGEHADFVGPPPGLASQRDRRLLRRELRLERIAIHTFGPRNEEIELCVTLPEDASEPVPARNADLSHVLKLLDARLRITPDAEERRELVRLLVRIDTDAARRRAVAHAGADAVAELLPLAERGDRAAAARLLDEIVRLDLRGKERALAAALGAEEDARVRGLCAHEDVAVAVLAADALFARRDPSGVAALFRHPDRYARAAAGALALRLTPLAAGLRIVAEPPADLPALARLAGAAFTERDGKSFVKLGEWLAFALTAGPDQVRERRSRHPDLYLGKRRVSGSEFAGAYAEGIRAGRAPELWGPLMQFLLYATDPGVGIPERSLDPLLDALAARARGELERTWIDALVCLLCAQYGVEVHREFFDLAQARLLRLAGDNAPAGVRSRAGVFWPIWAAAR